MHHQFSTDYPLHASRTGRTHRPKLLDQVWYMSEVVEVDNIHIVFHLCCITKEQMPCFYISIEIRFSSY